MQAEILGCLHKFLGAPLVILIFDIFGCIIIIFLILN